MQIVLCQNSARFFKDGRSIRISVHNLDQEIEVEVLDAWFSAYGEVKRTLILLVDTPTVRSNSALVDMPDRNAGEQAIARLQGTQLGRSRLHLAEFGDRRAPQAPSTNHPGSPGVAGSR